MANVSEPSVRRLPFQKRCAIVVSFHRCYGCRVSPLVPLGRAVKPDRASPGMSDSLQAAESLGFAGGHAAPDRGMRVAIRWRNLSVAQQGPRAQGRHARRLERFAARPPSCPLSAGRVVPTAPETSLSTKVRSMPFRACAAAPPKLDRDPEPRPSSATQRRDRR